MPDGTLRARLLGAFEVEIDGRGVDRAAFERPSGLRLLKLLLATPEHRVRREAAAELLWPEADPERSAANLRKAIHFARSALPGLAGGAGSALATEGDVLRLAPNLTLDIDVDRLDAAVDRLGSGATTVAGDLETLAQLAGATLLPEDPYEEWLVPLRDRLERRVQTALLEGIAVARQNGRPELAMQLARAALALDAADEGAHRAVIEMHLEAGQIHAARRQLLTCADALATAYGVAAPPELELLIAGAAAARPAAASASAQEGEIVGRRRELELLEGPLDAVVDGRLGALVVRGEAGIGKTRLIREIIRASFASGWRMLELRGIEHAVDTPFASLGRAIVQIVDAQTVHGWPEPERSAAMTIAPAIGAAGVLSFTTDDALRTGVVAAIARLASEGPLVLVADDIQWLDAPTVELIGAVLAPLQDRPILVAVGLRDEPRPLGAPADHLAAEILRTGGSEVRLGPMGGREIERLLERDAGGVVEPSALHAIVELAGGVPLYALELFREAVRVGTLVPRDGQHALVNPKATIPVPRGVAQVVDARTKGLEPNARSVLAVAAELGDEVAFEPLLAATSVASERVLEALDAGISANLLIERGGGYAFGHPLFRAALRRVIPRGERARLYGRIAAALAGGIEPDDVGAIDAAIAGGIDAAAIAGHAATAAELGEASATALAVGFGFAAGARHFALLDQPATAATLRRALALWYRLSPEERDRYPAARAQMHLGLALKAMRDNAGASDAFRAAAAVAGTDDDRARAWAAMSWLPYEHGEFNRAERILREGLANVAEPAARAFLESGLGWILGRRGDWTAARELLTRSTRVLEPVAPPDLLARAVDRLAVSIRDTGEPAAALPVFERALRLAIEAGAAHEEAMVRMHYAGGLLLVGDLEPARIHLRRGLEICTLTGDRYIEAVTTWILAEVEDRGGNLAEAIRLRELELRILEPIGNPQNQAMAHAHIAHLAQRAGDPERARSAAAEARRLALHAGIAGLPEAVERAIAAPDWYAASHRTAAAAVDATGGPGTAREQPPQTIEM